MKRKINLIILFIIAVSMYIYGYYIEYKIKNITVDFKQVESGITYQSYWIDGEKILIHK